VLQYAAASANPDLIATNTVTINGTGQLDFNGASDIVGPVTIASYGAPSDSTPILNTTGGGNWAVNGLLTVTPVPGYLTRIDTGTGTLTLSNNLLFNASGAGRLQISGNLSLGTSTNRYFTINQGLYQDYDVLIDAVISGAPGTGFTKDSTVYSWGTATGGILRFAGANTFDGSVTMNDSNKGTLVLANNQALGVPSTNRTMWIGSGCTLALDGGVTLSDPNNRIELVLKGTGDSRLAGVSGTGVAQSGALFSLSGTNTVPCRISLSNATQIASSKRLVLQGMVYGGAYGLTFAGPGETAVSGASGMITNASSITLIANATLSLENTVAANKPDRIINTIPMTLNGGSIRFANDGSAADFAETLGALTVNMGSNTIFASQAAASQTSALVFASINRVSGTVNFVGEGLGVDARNRIFITGLGDGMIGPWATINGTNLALYSSARGVYAGSGTEYGVAALGGTDASVIPDDASASAVINTQGSFGPITVANVWTNRILEVRQATEYASTVRMVQGVTNRTLQTSRISIGEGKASVTISENSNEGALMALSSGGILTLENLNPSATLSVKSAIPNNGTSASSLYKFGAGTVVLSGSNSYAGATMINEGTFEVSGSSTQTLAGVISGNGALVKSGSGKLSLGSDNTYTGLTTIAQGTVVANQNAAFGSTAVGTVIGSGATLDVGSTKAIHQLSLAEPFTVSGKGVNNLGAIVNNSAVEQGNAFGKITLAGDTTFGGISRWDLRASTPVLTMNGYNITKVGANTIMLCTTVVYPNGEGGTGNINFNTGALRLESWNNLNGSAANKLTIGSGVQLSLYNFQNVYPANWTLALATNAWVVGSAGAGSSYNVWSGPVSLTGWAVLAPGSGTSVTFTNVLSGDGAIIKSDVGTVYLTSSTNTYTGATTVSNGTLYAKYPGSLPGYNDGRLTVAGGGTVAVNASDGTFGFTSEQIRDLNLNASFKAVNAILSIDTTSANLTCPYDLPKLMGLTKLGTNALTLARNAVLGNIVSYDGTLNLYGNNTCSGGLALVCGKASMTGTNTFIGSGDIYFGSSTLTNGTLTIGPNGRLTCGGNFRISTANGSGALYLNGGSFTNSAADSDFNFGFGRETNSYGYFRMTGGSVGAGRFQMAGNADNTSRARALARISGGTLSFNAYVLLTRNVGCESVLTLDGGTINHTVGNELSLARQGGRCEINICGGTFNNANMNTMFQPTSGFGSGTGIVNLCAGSLITAPLQNPFGAPAFLNFCGGTLAPSGDSTIFVPNTMSNVYAFGAYSGFAGGAVIDSNGKAIAIPAVIRNPTGQGVASIAVANAGAGYIGEPYVSIEGGSGTGATAVANLVDDGTGRGTFSVGSVTVTCPGVGYAAMPTVLFKGGGFNIVTALVGTVTLADNVGGGLTKVGTGTLTLSAANTYTGVTTIAGGTLKLGTATALMTNSPIVLAGGMLDLGGYTITNAISGSGSVSNGTFSTTLSPNGPGVLGTNTLALGSAAVIKGTYEADVTANGRCDRLNIQGNIDLSKLDLQIVNANLLDRTKVYTILSCTGTLTGRLTIKNIGLDSRWHVVNRSDGSVQLRFTNGTFMFMR
jgi:autotransporter-associated beta strand protein